MTQAKHIMKSDYITVKYFMFFFFSGMVLAFLAPIHRMEKTPVAAAAVAVFQPAAAMATSAQNASRAMAPFCAAFGVVLAEYMNSTTLDTETGLQGRCVWCPDCLKSKSTSGVPAVAPAQVPVHPMGTVSVHGPCGTGVMRGLQISRTCGMKAGKPIPHPITVMDVRDLGLCVVISRRSWHMFSVALDWSAGFADEGRHTATNFSAATPLLFRTALVMWLKNSGWRVEDTITGPLTLHA